MIQLRRFNQQGVDRFRVAIHALQDGKTLDVQNLLSDGELTEVLSDEGVLEVRPFANRRDAGQYMFEVMTRAEGELDDVDRDVGLWSWLAAAWMDEIIHVSNGVQIPGADARWIPEVGDYRKYYRHLLAGPFQIYRAHRDNPDRAMVILATAVGSPGEAAEQLSARQEIVTNPNLLETATRLYYDPEAGSLKAGHAGKGGGSTRRLAKDIIRQFDLTWDFYGMSPNEILSLLPAEFDRFRPDALA
jgi:hypothetical protein